MLVGHFSCTDFYVLFLSTWPTTTLHLSVIYSVVNQERGEPLFSESTGFGEHSQVTGC